MFVITITFLSTFILVSAGGASAEGNLPAPPPPPLPLPSKSSCSAPATDVVVAYEISEDCRIVDLRTIIDGRVFYTQDTSPLFTQMRIFAYVEGMRRPLRERTIDLLGGKYDGEQLRCQVDAMDRVVSAWIERPTSEHTLRNGHRRTVELSDGDLPDFGTLSGEGEVQGACDH